MAYNTNCYTILFLPGKSWAQYHILEKHTQPQVIKDTNSLLPQLPDKVNTLEMQVLTMQLQVKAIKALNPDQTAVDVSDFPLYAVTKEEQFHFPDRFINYFSLFGGLHIEQCLLVTDEQFIEGIALREILESCSLSTIEG